MREPDTEGQILSDSTHRGSPEESHPQRQEVDGGGQGLGEGLGSQCFMGTEFQFGEMRKFWRWRGRMAVKQCERT